MPGQDPVRKAETDGIIFGVDYLAVAQMPSRWSRSPLRILFRRSYRPPRAWHAVAQQGSEPVALCGYHYTRELHRTWNQTSAMRRCRKCERLMAEAEWKQFLRGPLWASPWAPDGTEALDDPDTVDVGAGRNRANPHNGRNANLTHHGQHSNGAHNGHASHGPNGAASARAADQDVQRAPWTGRPIRRNGVLPSDAIRL